MLGDGAITCLYTETGDILPHTPQTPSIHPLDLWLAFAKPTNKEVFAEFPLPSHRALFWCQLSGYMAGKED